MFGIRNNTIGVFVDITFPPVFRRNRYSLVKFHFRLSLLGQVAADCAGSICLTRKFKVRLHHTCDEGRKLTGYVSYGKRFGGDVGDMPLADWVGMRSSRGNSHSFTRYGVF